MSDTKKIYLKGIEDGMPIALGYFAVAFTLGIAARNAGLSPIQAFIASLTNNASAGEYAGFTLIAADAGYLEMVFMMIVTNARYLLMSCALSQKFSSDTSLLHRMLIGFDVTDEIFGICVSVKGRLNPAYPYGAMTVAIPGWAFGTMLGVILGNALPANIVRALSVGLFGMFIAIIIPPARKNRILAGIIVCSMTASYLFTKLPVFHFISSGVKTIILTVIIAGIAAILFPVAEEQKREEGTN
ncbi:MAG: AzlC family ABC transporter permease [Clostridia bacterium]|nr:AzlC family ABC transporter permease [Clostridia bacterium]